MILMLLEVQRVILTISDNFLQIKKRVHSESVKNPNFITIPVRKTITQQLYDKKRVPNSMITNHFNELMLYFNGIDMIII